MSLMIGRGPLAEHTGGERSFDVPLGARLVERLPRRLRAVRAGATVVDSEDVMVVHEQGALPYYAIPTGDVRLDEGVGEASLDGHVRVEWDAVDAWFEEDERVLVHPRDPYHRIDAFATSRRVRIGLSATTIADSTRAVALYETSLPVQYYLPVADVRSDLLVPSATVTECPYKGAAAHLHAIVDGDRHEDVAWTYRDEVRREALAVRGLIAFYADEVEIEITPTPPA